VVAADALWLAPAVMLVLALGPWPYGYYLLLKLVVCGAAGFWAWSILQGRSGARGLGWTLVLVALLYNPLFRVPFDRGVWGVINVATALLFAGAGPRGRRGG
jgi:hypothetical protein